MKYYGTKNKVAHKKRRGGMRVKSFFLRTLTNPNYLRVFKGDQGVPPPRDKIN